MKPEQALTRTLLARGMLVGLAAGLVALVVAKIFGEPQVAAAIAYESAHDAAAGGSHGPELVSRTVQSTIGLGTGICLFGIALGGIYALAFAFVQGRIAPLGARSTAALLALAGFFTVALVPLLKYPANPPAADDPDTIGRRTALYFILLAASVITAIVAVKIGKALTPRQGVWNATIIGVAVFVVIVGVVMLVTPGVDEVPVDFPASVLWKFRIASLAGQFVTWATLGLLFGALTERSLRKTRNQVPVRARA